MSMTECDDVSDVMCLMICLISLSDLSGNLSLDGPDECISCVCCV